MSLHHVSIIFPAITIYVKNCYSVHPRLFVIGKNEIRSCEGTTKVDPVAMFIYGTAIIPLILMVVDINSQVNNTTKTAAYVDDLTAAGKIIYLKHWWEILARSIKITAIPWLIVKENAKREKLSVFKNTTIKSHPKDNSILEQSLVHRNSSTNTYKARLMN